MVIRREYLDRVRKKSFWIGTLVFPLIMVGLLTIPAALRRAIALAAKGIVRSDSGQMAKVVVREMRAFRA